MPDDFTVGESWHLMVKQQGSSNIANFKKVL